MNKIEKLNPRDKIANIMYEIMSAQKKPFHYEEIVDALGIVGYYKVRKKSKPMNFTALNRSMLRDERFEKLEEGYYGLKEWSVNLNKSTEPEIDYSKVTCEEFEAKRNNNIENTVELSKTHMILDDSFEFENKSTNLDELNSCETILPNDVLTIFKIYYDKDEIEDLEKRARKEYYDRFLPLFISAEMGRISERSKI